MAANKVSMGVAISKRQRDELDREIRRVNYLTGRDFSRSEVVTRLIGAALEHPSMMEEALDVTFVDDSRSRA